MCNTSDERKVFPPLELQNQEQVLMATNTVVHCFLPRIRPYCVSSMVALLEKVQAVLSFTSAGISFLSS